MNIKCENLGYLEIGMLVDFLEKLGSGENKNLDDYISSRKSVTIGFDLKYHGVYLEDEGFRFYPEDFE